MNQIIFILNVKLSAIRARKGTNTIHSHTILIEGGTIVKMSVTVSTPQIDIQII